jgi:hypothetical protein
MLICGFFHLNNVGPIALKHRRNGICKSWAYKPPLPRRERNEVRVINKLPLILAFSHKGRRKDSEANPNQIESANLC